MPAQMAATSNPALLARPGRRIGLLLVVAIHMGAAWLLLLESPAQRRAAPAAMGRLLVRIVPPPEPAPPRSELLPRPFPPQRDPARARTATTLAPATPGQPAPPAMARSTEPQAITPPRVDAGTAEPDTPRAPPLDLKLPRSPAAFASAPARRESPGSMAARDPRSNTARAGLGDTLARQLGTDDRITDEDRGDGRRRIRQGANCVDVRDARSAAIDPFNQATRPPPKVAEACQ